MSYFLKSTIAAAIALASVAASAEITTLSKDTKAGGGSNTDYTLPKNAAVQGFRAVVNGTLSFTLEAGEIGVATPNDSSFAAYCLNPTIGLNLPGQYNITDTASRDAVARLFTVAGFNGQNYATDSVDTVVEQVALQFAIWEVTLDSLAGSSFAGGNFSFDQSVTRIDASGNVLTAFGNADALTLANTYLTAAKALQPGQYYSKVTTLIPVEGYNSQPLVTTVPEPSTYALMAACLGIVGFVARRKTA